jgi:peroxiredoxin
VIGASSDSPEESRDLRECLGLPFSLYSDPGCQAIRALGIYHANEPKGRNIARPAIYVLDTDRTIQYRYVGKNSRDRPLTADILDLVQRIQSRQTMCD